MDITRGKKKKTQMGDVIPRCPPFCPSDQLPKKEKKKIFYSGENKVSKKKNWVYGVGTVQSVRCGPGGQNSLTTEIFPSPTDRKDVAWGRDGFCFFCRSHRNSEPSYARCRIILRHKTHRHSITRRHTDTQCQARGL